MLTLTADGDAGTVEALQLIIDPQPMYNLTVDEAHTYFVGDGELLVHNVCLRSTDEEFQKEARHYTMHILETTLIPK